MGTMISKWRPSWWTEEVHGSAWDRIKEAMRSDWMQTKHDLGVGGHELNQTLVNTVKQAGAKEHLLTINDANVPKVIRHWREAEISYGFGHAARTQFGARHPRWNEGLEQKLKGEWMAAQSHVPHDWAAVRSFVRRGYEYQESESPTLSGGVGAPTLQTHEVSWRQ